MSALMHFSIFPVDKGEHLSEYVARAVRVIRDSGLPYQFGPMGTTIEGSWSAVVAVAGRCLEALEADCNRIIVNMKVDYKRDSEDRMHAKVLSVETRLEG